MNKNLIAYLVVCALMSLSIPSGFATTVWDGPMVTFTKPAFADFNDPQFQDRLTDNVWITRGNTRGLYNAAKEPEYNQLFGTSPIDTMWALGTTADLPNLTFTTWFEWTGGAGTGQGLPITNRPSVLHLVSDDIYIDITITQWSQGMGSGNVGGGAVSYIRSSPGTTIPEPSSIVMAGLAVSALCFAARKRLRVR